MDLKKVLPVAANVISWLSLKKIVMLVCAGLVLIFVMTIFENRSVVTKIFKPKDYAIPAEHRLVVADDTQKKIQELVTRSPDINMIMIIGAEIRVNQRELVYYFSDDVTIDLAMKSYIGTHSTRQPIFSVDERNNAQMVSVINGEFGCYKYEASMSTIIAPAVSLQAPAICRISLPPYYGEFSGYVNITLSKFPDVALQNQIRIDAVRLATEIYDRSQKQ